MEFPLLGQQVAVDLANTVWVYAGQRVDALDTVEVADRWLVAVGSHRLGDGGTLRDAAGGTEALHVRDEGFRADLQALREHVRALLNASASGQAADSATLEALNGAAAAAPSRVQAIPDGQAHLIVRLRPPPPRTAVLAALAEDALLMVAPEEPLPVFACPGPGCLGVLVRDDPRRRYCSPNCANRARVARHYARTRPPG
ncbi:CGNR zinc finger domain-containing protein [Sporichthya sp.]|uniref:CGNR zinc finger domain-containing protein n=1 Tax=Sporichthya sp. TaxID=65475 RepID=UPI0018113D9B|nr:CGNR zinc finger domain-containing protein [Sporichthya sp.]MBA3743977.1 CGNR zinc finger domain-containing protein [Sporichthya sp.]